MTSEKLKALQSPIKARYRESPEAARFTIRSTGRVDPTEIACHVDTGTGTIAAGLHPKVGGDGSWACSGDILMQALVACAGVTLSAVAASMGISLTAATVVGEGDIDFRGTLGVSRETPVGLTGVRLSFEIDADATDEQLAKLIELTERYCVIYQTLAHSPLLATTVERG